MRHSTRFCQQRSSRNSIQMDAALSSKCSEEESDWVDIDEEIFGSLATELDLDDNYVWL